LIAGLLIMVGLASFALPSQRFPAGLLLVVVGIFVIIGAGYEEFWLQRRLKLSSIRAGTAVRAPTWTVSPGDTVTPLLNIHSFELQPALPVLLGRRVVGMILEKDVRTALTQPGRLTIAHVMRADFPRVRATDSLWQALELLSAYGYPALPVVNNGRFEGLITHADVRRESGRNGSRPAGRGEAVPGLRAVPLGEKQDV
jgi:CBS-domain-containing membrane protein